MMSPIETRLSLTGTKSKLIQVDVAITCYAPLHQATRAEVKNSLRECRDIIVSQRDPQRFFFIMLPQF